MDYGRKEGLLVGVGLIGVGVLLLAVGVLPAAVLFGLCGIASIVYSCL